MRYAEVAEAEGEAQRRVGDAGVERGRGCDWVRNERWRLVSQVFQAHQGKELVQAVTVVVEVACT